MRRKATVSSCFDRRATVPMIRLRGQWLERVGFDKGQPIQIDVEEGRIVLQSTGPVLKGFAGNENA